MKLHLFGKYVNQGLLSNKMSPFYIEGNHQWISKMAFPPLLPILVAYLPVEIYIFRKNSSILNFRENVFPDLTLSTRVNPVPG
jgi:hypothetical protein